MLADLVVTATAGVLFGLALAAPPGPMNAIIAEESVIRGWFAGFRAGLGAMTADFVFFLLALAGVARLIESLPTLRSLMITVGGILMLYFAYGAVESLDESLSGSEPSGRSHSFFKTFVLGLTNPYQILFWLTVGIGLLHPGQLDVFAQTPYLDDVLGGTIVVETGSGTLVGGLFAGILFWIVTFPGTLVAGGRRIDSLTPVIAGLSAFILAGFGILFLFDGLGSLL